jgi:hypothetical protein
MNASVTKMCARLEAKAVTGAKPPRVAKAVKADTREWPTACSGFSNDDRGG